MTGELDHPYEPADRKTVTADHQLSPDLYRALEHHAGIAISSGMVVAAAWIEPENMGPLPMLVFRFTVPDGSGTMTEPVGVILTDGQMAALEPLMTKSIADARFAAHHQRQLASGVQPDLVVPERAEDELLEVAGWHQHDVHGIHRAADTCVVAEAACFELYLPAGLLRELTNG